MIHGLPPSHPLADRHRNPNRPAKTIADYQEAAGRIVQCQPARPTSIYPHSVETQTTSIKPVSTTALAERILHGRTCQCAAHLNSPWSTVSCSNSPKQSIHSEPAIKQLCSAPDLSTLPKDKSSSISRPIVQTTAETTLVPRSEEDWKRKIGKAILTLVEYRVLSLRESRQRSGSGFSSRSDVECTRPVAMSENEGLEDKEARLPSEKAIRTHVTSPSFNVHARPVDRAGVEQVRRAVVNSQPECVKSTDKPEAQEFSVQSAHESDSVRQSGSGSASEPSTQLRTTGDQPLNEQTPHPVSLCKVTSATVIPSLTLLSRNVSPPLPSSQAGHPFRGYDDEPHHNKRRRVEAEVVEELKHKQSRRDGAGQRLEDATAPKKDFGKKKSSEQVGDCCCSLRDRDWLISQGFRSRRLSRT